MLLLNIPALFMLQNCVKKFMKRNCHDFRFVLRNIYKSNIISIYGVVSVAYTINCTVSRVLITSPLSQNWHWYGFYPMWYPVFTSNMKCYANPYEPLIPFVIHTFSLGHLLGIRIHTFLSHLSFNLEFTYDI